jgi:hypothetical protein
MRMIRRILAGAAVLSGLVLALPASAATINLTVSSGGIDSSNTRTCSTSACTAAIWSLGSGESYAATGTIAIDTTLNTMTIALAVATSVIDASGAQTPTDLGASSLAFTGGTYTAVVGVTPSGGGTYTINAGQSAAVAFTLVQAVGAGAGAPVSIGAVRLTGSCLVTGGTGQCGLIFGSQGTTPFQVGGAGFGGYSRFVRHTFNVGVVPEPTTLLLVAVGLTGLAIRSRRSA